MLTDDQKKYLIPIIAVLMFCAGFALADQVLYDGAITPDPLKFLTGWFVCIGVGVYAAALFKRQNS
jgi:hypothetical protein